MRSSWAAAPSRRSVPTPSSSVTGAASDPRPPRRHGARESGLRESATRQVSGNQPSTGQRADAHYPGRRVRRRCAPADRLTVVRPAHASRCSQPILRSWSRRPPDSVTAAREHQFRTPPFQGSHTSPPDQGYARGSRSDPPQRTRLPARPPSEPGSARRRRPPPAIRGAPLAAPAQRPPARRDS
jgi:hypothetical protein